MHHQAALPHTSGLFPRRNRCWEDLGFWAVAIPSERGTFRCVPCMTWCSKAQGNYTSDVKGSPIAHKWNGTLVFGHCLTTKTQPPSQSELVRSHLPLQLDSSAMMPGWITVVLGIGELGGGKLVHQIAANIVAIPRLFTLCTRLCENGHLHGCNFLAKAAVTRKENEESQQWHTHTHTIYGLYTCM